MELPSQDVVRQIVGIALAEDVGAGDLTTRAIIPGGTWARGRMVSREPLVVAGLPVAIEVFRQVDPGLMVQLAVADGLRVGPDQSLLEITGPTGSMLTAERVALNFVQRLSGIATLTRQYVEAVQETQALILDTRKTTPGLRPLEKYAVRCGGARNHRAGLFDAILIKDNHLSVLRRESANPIATAVERARAQHPGRKIEVEADHLDQVEAALAAGADVILLDNMNPIQMRLAVQHARGRAQTEASGGVNLGTVRPIAEAGVDAISVGAITHSARAMDVAFEIEAGPDHRAQPGEP